MSEEKQKVLALTVEQMDKKYGKGTIMKMGGETVVGTISGVISTGSLSLDIALGIGGVPRGRVIEIFGPESSGKSTLALHIIAEAQKQGGTAAYIDVEHTFDTIYAGHCGVKLEEMYMSQPDTGEQAMDVTEALVRSGGIDVIVIDSVAALVPRAEIEGDMGDSHVGLQARLMSQALRKLTAAISKSNTSVVFINQLREKVGVFFGNPEVTPGGRALKFYSSVRIDLRRKDSIKIGEEVVGSHIQARVVKNKVAPPFKLAEFDIMFDHGISREGNIIDLGLTNGLIKKSGAFLSFGDTRLGQGREQAKEFLRQNIEVAQQLETRIKEKATAPSKAVAD